MTRCRRAVRTLAAARGHRRVCRRRHGSRVVRVRSTRVRRRRMWRLRLRPPAHGPGLDRTVCRGRIGRGCHRLRSHGHRIRVGGNGWRRALRIRGLCLAMVNLASASASRSGWASQPGTPLWEDHGLTTKHRSRPDKPAGDRILPGTYSDGWFAYRSSPTTAMTSSGMSKLAETDCTSS